MFTSEMRIAGFDPELAKAIAGERPRQERSHRADRLGELHKPARARGPGVGSHQQVRRRLPRQALLRRLRSTWTWRSRWPSSGPKAFSAPRTRTCSRIRGSQANAAVYMALLNPGDTILGMSLDHGGHLTHGAKVNFSGKLFKAVQYGIKADTGEIDYEQVERLAQEHRPK